MAKQGQHKNDAHDPRKSAGRNNPKESMTITTGSYKKPETYEQQARERRDTDPQPQAAKPHWDPDSREPSQGTRYPGAERRRSGSDSNADSGTRGH
jgi:hypothetical protein